MGIHKPVLLKEVLDFLLIKRDGIYVDATAGFGGHSEGILSKLSEEGSLIAIDRDRDAVDFLTKKIRDPRFKVIIGNFADLKELLRKEGINEVDGVLFDLGVSLFQLKETSRGFSFMSDSRLDMRMDKTQTLDAWEVVNTYSQKELERVFREFGEEPYAKGIAKAIVENRKRKEINTCKELSSLIEKLYGKRGKIHPATRAFQAIRIEVNRELECLQKGLIEAYESLRNRGRLCVISYHSLEDRIVKNFFKDYAFAQKMRVITKKPYQPSLEERKLNPSSRSAKLRVGEKI